MGTRKVKLTGYAKWAKVFEQNRDLTGYEDALKDIGGQCTIDVSLEPEDVDKLKRSKSMLKGKDCDEYKGRTSIRFRRKWEEQYAGGAPTVLKADGSKWDYEEDGLIGNGSLVEVVLQVYDTSRPRIVGTRLERVKVLEAKTYNPDEGYFEESAPSAPPPAIQTKKVELDDEIPFE